MIDEPIPTNGAEPAPFEEPVVEDAPLEEMEVLRLQVAEQAIEIAELRLQLQAYEQQVAIQNRARAQRAIEARYREGDRYELLPGAPDGHVRRRRREPT